MRKKIFGFFKSSVFYVLSLAILIAAPIMIFSNDGKAAATGEERIVMSVWQIDGFEGGKGSRSAFLQNLGDSYSKKSGCYINVVSLTADAARMNLEKNVVPDLISFGAGMSGIENNLRGKTPYYTWCYGGYCLLTLDTNSDFSDVNKDNTVINGGTGNFVGAESLLLGVNGAYTDKPTGAYVKLINGEYKYLLGTQRDIFRLKTRGAAFSMKPLTEFNDLYQNISITTSDDKKLPYAEKFISYVLENADVSKLGLMKDAAKLYDDEMSAMEGLNYNYKLIAPISENIRYEIESAITNSDEIKLKTLLK